MVTTEEASRNVFEDSLKSYERATEKVFTDPEDRKALADMISEWRRLGPETLCRLSMNQPWNMPLYFALSAAVLNRREINELREHIKQSLESRVPANL